MNLDPDALEAAARAVHETIFGYEGQNPKSIPDDEDRAIARAAVSSYLAACGVLR